ncbi:hypothetical protein HB884_07985 [Listeria booriae]|uniref:Uncharacterized protein n=1 Tax=Listeria booriae TaxID=1552123 RepID=A0A7X0XCY0_9LIST|nr:hypothetical protein [Listeria booriae]MBC1491920.1 hypothetical protein [Listeria booriae]MBC1524145.1 hypothetical protein [Listeria booriae]
MSESRQITRDIMVALIQNGGLRDVNQLTNTYRKVFEVVHESGFVYDNVAISPEDFANKRNLKE